MNITLSEPTKVMQFASIMKNLKNFSQDVEFVVSENGVYTQGMDGSHCCLYEMILKNDWFDKFDTDKRYVLGLNCELLAKVLNCLEQNQKIIMQYTEDRDDLFISLCPNDGETSIVKVFLTFTDLPEPISTSHTLSLSASGCFSAFKILAITN